MCNGLAKALPQTLSSFSIAVSAKINIEDGYKWERVDFILFFLLYYYPGLQQYLSSHSLICYNLCLPFILEEKSISLPRIWRSDII